MGINIIKLDDFAKSSLGSIDNMILSTVASKAPAVGDGATIIMYTDRHAVTVISAGPETVRVQRDFEIRTDSNGMSDSQSYTYAPNPDGFIQTFTLRKNDRWIEQGGKKHNGTQLLIGTRRAYHDYGF